MSIAFSASSTDPQNEQLTYNWDFGDGTGASGGLVNHSFSNAGDYTVKVTAVNQHNKSASAKGFLATTHTFEREAVARGQTQYHRTGISVPPGTTLMLVIVDQRPGPTSAQ